MFFKNDTCSAVKPPETGVSLKGRPLIILPISYTVINFILGFSIPFIKDGVFCDLEKKKMISELSKIPHIKKISRIIPTKDFSPVFDFYIEMEDDVKIIFRNVHYDGTKLDFKTISRFGNFCFIICDYDISKKQFVSYKFNIFNEFDDRFYKIGESPFCTNSVVDVLKNYKTILYELNLFHTVGKEFLDFLKNGRDEEAFAIYNGKIIETFSGYKTIRCIYEYIDDYEETFFGAQSKWIEDGL